MFGDRVALLVDRVVTEGAVKLTLVDPARKMRKYYRLALQLNLWGGEDLVREWGPLPGGRRPRVIVEQPGDRAALLDRLGRQLRARLREGYSPA